MLLIMVLTSCIAQAVQVFCEEFVIAARGPDNCISTVKVFSSVPIAVKNCIVNIRA